MPSISCEICDVVKDKKWKNGVHIFNEEVGREVGEGGETCKE